MYGLPCYHSLFPVFQPSSPFTIVSHFSHISPSALNRIFQFSPLPHIFNPIFPSSIYYTFLSNIPLFYLLLLPLQYRPLLFITPSSPIPPSSIYYTFLSNTALFYLLHLPLQYRPLLFITPSSPIPPSSIYYTFLSNTALFYLLHLPLQYRPLLFITPSSPITHSSIYYPFLSPYLLLYIWINSNMPITLDFNK